MTEQTKSQLKKIDKLILEVTKKEKQIALKKAELAKLEAAKYGMKSQLVQLGHRQSEPSSPTVPIGRRRLY